MEASNKDLEKMLFNPMDGQELQNPEKVSKISVKNLDPSVKRLNNTKSSMIGMKPKDAIKLDIVPLDKKYPEESTTQGRFIQIPLSTWQKTWRSSIRLNCTRTRQSCRVLFAGWTRWSFCRKELVNISDDTQVPPDWVREWK